MLGGHLDERTIAVRIRNETKSQLRMYGMHRCPRGAECGGCPAPGGGVICHCLQITEDQLVSAVTDFELRTILDVRRFTGAGEGCTACHRKIQLYLDSYSPSSSAEICSAR